MKSMRVLRLALCLFCCAVQGGCAAKDTAAAPAHPEWLQVHIDKLKASRVTNVPASVVRAQYKGETVYYISTAVPDGYGTLYDAQGKVLGHPDGGMNGRGDGRCSDFFDVRTEVVPIWPTTEK